MTDLPTLVRDAIGDQRVLVALSGGLDSVVLLHATVAAIGSERVAAAHVNHHLREAAHSDAAFCTEFAHDLGVPCEIVDVHPESSNTQADSRTRRYAGLGRAADAFGCTAIVTAHHADDVVETFLERLARGAGLSAMLGLGAQTTILNHTIIRPLLPVTKHDLETWAQEHQLSYREDVSNRDTHYRRNALRHDVIPALTAEHGVEPLRRSIENLRGEAELVSQAVDQLVMAASRPAPGLRSARLERNWLSTAAPALRRRALIEVAATCGIALQHAHLADLEKPRTEPSRVDLPGGHAIISNELTTFYAHPAVSERTPAVSIDLDESPSGTLPWYDIVIIWKSRVDDAHLWLPEGAELVIDGPTAGESIATTRGSRTVRELLREAGVPAEDRWRWPVIRHDDRCIAVPGLEFTGDRRGDCGVKIEIVRRSRRPE